ncbi:MAG: PLP-dependent aminotransferase family protein [Trueperaceae bacterium]
MDSAAVSTPTIEATWRPGVIDLGPGHPSTDLLPLELMRGAAQGALGGSDASFLQYGVEPGSLKFRQLLAATITAETGVGTDPDELFVTAGASQGLDVICTLFTRPGQAVLVAEPTYFLALKVFADRGLKVVPVPCDEHGPVLAEVEAALAAHAPTLMYLVPSFANPTGISLAAERRTALLDLTAGSGTLVVADEVYRFLQFAGQPPASLAGGGRPHVVSLNSFSKTLAPGLRLGWLAGSAEVLGRVGASGFLQSGGGLNPFVAAVVGELLANGRFAAHLNHLRAVYAQRATALADGLRAHAPALEFAAPRGGYFVWARLPGADHERLRRLAREAGADYAPGAAFSSGGRYADHLRLSFSHYSPDELVEGARRIGEAVKAELELA